MALRPSRSSDAVAENAADASALLEHAVRAIDAECAVALGSDAVVSAACDRIRAARATWWVPPHPALIATLFPLLSTRTGTIAGALFALVEDLAREAPDPVPFVRAMLSARDSNLARRAIDVASALTASGRLRVNRELLSTIAVVADESSALLSRELFEPLAAWLSSGEYDLATYYVGTSDRDIRRLAARILDVAGRPSAHVVTRVLGESAAALLLPYLDYTRATHVDLLDLADGGRRVVESLRAAERICGPAMMRHAVDAIGWTHLNRGLDVRPLTAISVAGALPLFLSNEASLFARCRDAETTGDCVVLVGHGEAPATAGARTDADDRIARFRGANLVHAEALAELLDLSPLTRTRVERLLAMLDRLTDDFNALFSDAADECAPVARVYADLRQRIVDAMAASNDAEVVRLVQPFEDPAIPADIGSLHGLKRYLHQRSLKLAFRLVQGARGTNRTATPIVARDGRVIAADRPIEYIDFEPADDDAAGAPYPVQIVIDAFAHQLLHGVATLPSIRIYCYGNEVQYFVAFRNHPVFVRIDFSPPAGGGMIDLEYYGVSKYELAEHPNLSLDGIRACFERLDFAVTIENTRIHARYDKERARDTADLCARAEALFRLAPYLMDLDWQLGALEISPDARREVQHAWADVLARWGVLPFDRLTTADHQRILLGYEYGPTGPIEVPWRGDGPYRDIATTVSSENFVADVTRVLEELRLAGELTVTADDIAQIPFERKVLRAIRQNRPSARSAVREPEYLARVLMADDRTLADATRLALMIGQLERLLRFTSVGSINGYDVQRAELVLPGDVLTVAVLRDDSDIGRVASFAREATSVEPSTDAKAFAAILRRRNFPLAAEAARDADPPPTIRALFGSRSRRTSPIARPGEFLIAGTRAAAGRAVGLARFRFGRSEAADLEGTIFVTPRLSPDEGAFLVRADGVIATGGGVLSHAGLLAAEFERPALVVNGTWHDTRGLDRRLHIDTTEYDTITMDVGDFEVAVKHRVRAGVLDIRDGDLIELDADEGVARVYGQDRESLALHDSLTQLAAASARVLTASDPAEVLAERGRQVRAVHLLERLLAQIDRPALVAHAVRELLVGRAASVRATAPREHAALVRALLENPTAGVHARDCATGVYAALSQKFAAAHAAALREIPSAIDLAGVLLPRITMLRDRAAAESTAAALGASGVRVDVTLTLDRDEVDRSAIDRMRALRSATADRLETTDTPAHLLDSIDRCDTLIGGDSLLRPRVDALRRADVERQQRSVARARGAVVIGAADGGLELRPVIGGKAANLGEIVQLAGEALVPPWFAIAAGALEAVLAGGTRAGTNLRAAIERAAAVGAGDERQRANAIAALFDDAELAPHLIARILAAYHELEIQAGADAPRDGSGRLLVAVRSSAADEDATSATRAGEFDTFLSVAGDEELIRRIRRAWAGFWSARAIHGRDALGQSQWMSGGVIVQRMVAACSAGVVQTINTADRRAGEIVINAAFGLGAGVVSGSVAADHVIVSKTGLLDDEGPLRFRYATADKRQQVVFDVRTGAGTVMTDTLYHQRMRPALEYQQLAELARTAARLERAYGYALDIEFAFDRAQLWILQARPVPAWFGAVRETRERYPLTAREPGSGLGAQGSGLRQALRSDS